MNDGEISIASLLAYNYANYLTGDLRTPYVGSEGIAFVMSQIAKGLQPYYLCMDRGILICVTEELIPANGVIVEWLRPEIADNLNREYSAIKGAKLEIEDHQLAIAAIRERGTSKLF